jgi:hypothetical protein
MNKIKIYYSALLVIVLFQVAMTIFSGSMSVYYNKKATNLSAQKQALAKEKMRLSNELAQKSSLSYIKHNYDLSQYEPISNPIVISGLSTVASVIE